MRDRHDGKVRHVLLSYGIAFVLSATGFAAVAADPDLNKAEALMKAGRAADAYALLEPFEDKFAGDTRFDYLLGIAALDSGKADKATLAFERVLAVDPNFAGARLDMARAYFQLGDFPRAKAEFETVLQLDPPAVAKLTVRRYLDDIAQREKAGQTQITAYVEAAIGRDSNVNNSTAQTSVAVPGLGNLIFTLDATNVKRGDRYTMLTAGADIVHEIGPGLSVFGGGSGRYRSNVTEDRFDYNTGEGHGGMAISYESLLFRGFVNGERYYLDHKSNRNSIGAGAEVRYRVDDANFVSLFGQQMRHRFQTRELTVNDFDLSLVSLGWLRLFDEGRSMFSANLLAGRERAVNARPDGDKDIRGGRVGGQWSLREDVDLFGSMGWQKGAYALENAIFQLTREDRLFDATAGVVWRIDNAWSLRPQVLYIRNNSNIPIYAYNRLDYSITLRRDFR